MKFTRYFLLFCFCNITAVYVCAQRLDAIGKQDPLRITGGISTNQIAYFASGINSRRNPYTMYATANLNLDIYGWNVPFSASISNQSKGRFQQPFNQYSLNPSYKWITAHVGYTSMSFSSYTLNSHLFSGIGLDLAPAGPFKFNVMYGRLQKAVKPDTAITGNNIQPAYKRMGYGIKASYTKNRNFAEIILFKAKDQISSNPLIESQFNTVSPQDNFTSGINISKALLGKFFLTGELGLSLLTRNTLSTPDSIVNDRFKAAGFLLKTNYTTALYTAYKTGLAYGGKGYTLGLGYERISPEYKTLGAYYFANDFANITANLATKLLKDKLSLALSTGFQHDDLKKEKQSTARRVVGSLNLGYQANKKLNINTSYSNFQSFVNIRNTLNDLNALTEYDNLDTLNFSQISQNLNLSTNYILAQSKEKTKILNFNLSFMTSADKQGGVTQNSAGNFINLNSAYSINLIPKNISIASSFNLSTNKAGPIRNTMIGPTVGVNKSFFNKKLRSGCSTTWNASLNNGKMNSSVINLRINNSYTVQKKHNLNVSLVALNRASKSANQTRVNSFNEFTTTLGYNYNFK